MSILNTINKNRFEIFLLILILIGLSGSLATMELRAEEPRRAIVSMEMILGKEWIIPKIHGWNYYNKPPFFNWLMAIFFKIFGSFSEPVVRMPSLLSFLLTSLLVFKLTAKYADKKTGFIAAVLLLTSVDIFFYGSVDTGEIDLFLTLLIFIQGRAIFYYSEKEKWLSLFVVSYFFTAIGVLIKGLPPVIIQGLILIVWLAYNKQSRKLFSWQHLAGLLLFAAIITAYFFAYAQKENVYAFITQLMKETTQQSALETVWSSVVLNILKSPLQLFYISLPASGLLLYLFKKNIRMALKNNKLFQFSVIYGLINVVPYFIAGDTANRYLYPAFPFIAIMAALVYKQVLLSFQPSKWIIKYSILLWIFTGLAVLRIAYNIWGIPFQKKTSHKLIYIKLSSQLLNSSHGNPIYLTGYPEKLIANPTLPFIKIKPDTVSIPPLIPYQLPYYITKATGQIMRYDTIPQKNVYYLTPVDFLKNKKATIRYQFFDQWVKRELALVTFQ